MRRREVHLRVSKDAVEIVLHVLEHHIHRTARHHHLVQPHHVLVPQRLQQLDLAHRRHGKPVLFAIHSDLFQRHHRSRAFGACFEHLPVRPLAHLLDALVRLSASARTASAGYGRCRAIIVMTAFAVARARTHGLPSAATHTAQLRLRLSARAVLLLLRRTARCRLARQHLSALRLVLATDTRGGVRGRRGSGDRLRSARISPLGRPLLFAAIQLPACRSIACRFAQRLRLALPTPRAARRVRPCG